MGVTFFATDYPEYFAVFDRALVTMFRITSGRICSCFLSLVSVKILSILFISVYTRRMDERKKLVEVGEAGRGTVDAAG